MTLFVTETKMDSTIFSRLGIDPAVFLIIFAVLNIFLIVFCLLLALRSKKLFRRYDLFMRGKDAESLEDTLAQLCEQVAGLQAQDLANKDIMKVMNRNLVNSYQKTGLVKYNAFEGMGGQTSFALALLDLNNNGFILNVIHSRTACYNYIREISGGESETVLSTEEKAALDIAMKKKDRIYDSTGEK